MIGVGMTFDLYHALPTTTVAHPNPSELEDPGANCGQCPAGV